MQERTLELIRNDLKIITSNKLNTSQSKLLLIGVTYEILLRKDLFPKNSDLKKFVQLVFVEPIEGVKPFKEYLFVSRTLLSSRISKIILSQFSYNNVMKTVDKLNAMLPQQNNENKYSTRNTEQSMNEWVEFLRGNED
ncbi:hypothetical protein IEI_01263 [Bacillus wiedmannii]|uniref:hypothetical protein n=1 Tax=Bacillus cereus group TaxID=86661 RepID=UPI000278C091|nr:MULTISPECIES: hypothetical protein [Bacillus cereus group]EJQ54794.1 hypothetical protein IEI_01263 [Bacillus wiedmannii]MCU5326060.1 hypothetical protein [Bacillus cereus]PHC04037.1 hypothetical protein COE97_30640 [Bacillus toyonensis]